MNHHHAVRNHRVAFLFAVMLFGMSRAAAAQTAAAGALKIGIVPFADATASGNRAIGADIARTLQAELVHSTTLLPRVLESGAASGEMDAEKALALARAQHLDLVFVGTVLEARTEQSNKRGWLPSIKGQSASLDVHHLKATVVLQGEFYDLSNGERLFSTRVTGNNASNSVGGTAYTSFGSFGNESYAAFLDSPLGRALQAAVADMTRKIAAARPPRP